MSRRESGMSKDATLTRMPTAVRYMAQSWDALGCSLYVSCECLRFFSTVDSGTVVTVRQGIATVCARVSFRLKTFLFNSCHRTV